MNVSYLGVFWIKPSPTKHTLVAILFHSFFFLFSVQITFNTCFFLGSNFGQRGPPSSHFLFLFLFNHLAQDCPSLSSRHAATVPYGLFSILSLGLFLLCTWIVFFICIFSAWNCLWLSLAFRPNIFLPSLDVHEPLDLPSFSFSHGNPNDSHSACSVTQDMCFVAWLWPPICWLQYSGHEGALRFWDQRSVSQIHVTHGS